MALTPDDLRRIQFARARRGYDTDAVDGALQVVAESLESVLAERQELLEQLQLLQAENNGLRAGVVPADAVPTPPPVAAPSPEVDLDAVRRQVEEELRLEREVAQSESETTLDRARKEADRVLTDARAAAERLLRDAKDLAEHAVEEARSQAAAIRAEAVEEAGATLPAGGFSITPGAMPPEAALIALLGESRAVRALLESLLTRLGRTAPPPGDDPSG